MTSIRRQPDLLEQQRFDLIVIGGGIYGVCMLLEASRRGWTSLLLERNDFGGATSFNSLRILHGGLRYLQDFDLARFQQSVREQAWWLANFPDLVEPLPCLMPLYNRGLHRTSVMRCAFMVNDGLAYRIRRGTSTERKFQRSRILDASETKARFPAVRMPGLRGGALWFDLLMTSPQRLLIELLRWSIAAGGEALNYIECTGFDIANDRVQAVQGRCRVSGQLHSFQTDYVVSCAGPWLGEVPRGLEPAPITIPCADHAVAFNLVIDRPPLSDCGLAITPESGTSQSVFVVPFGDQTMVGTCHLPPQGNDPVSAAQVASFLSTLNLAVPDWKLKPADVRQVLTGRMPPRARNSHLPSKSHTVTHLEDHSGPRNVTCVAGPKYTTARHTAEVTIDEIARRRGMKIGVADSISRPPPAVRPDVSEIHNLADVAQDLQQWIQQESIVRPDDFLRRYDFQGDSFGRLQSQLANAHDWPE